MTVFRIRRKIRFSETDYAGIMFYPRYIEAINDTVEDWFRDVAGCSFETLLDEYKLGSPIISLETQFIKPNRIGDDIEISLSVEHLGRSSIRFLIQAHSGDELRVTSTLTHVCVERDISKSSRWPEDVRAKLSKGVN